MIRRVSATDFDGAGFRAAAALGMRRLYADGHRVWCDPGIREPGSGIRDPGSKLGAGPSGSQRVAGMVDATAVKRAISALSPCRREVPTTTVSPMSMVKLVSMTVRLAGRTV